MFLSGRGPTSSYTAAPQRRVLHRTRNSRQARVCTYAIPISRDTTPSRRQALQRGGTQALAAKSRGALAERKKVGKLRQREPNSTIELLLDGLGMPAHKRVVGTSSGSDQDDKGREEGDGEIRRMDVPRLLSKGDTKLLMRCGNPRRVKQRVGIDDIQDRRISERGQSEQGRRVAEFTEEHPQKTVYERRGGAKRVMIVLNSKGVSLQVWKEGASPIRSACRRQWQQCKSAATVTGKPECCCGSMELHSKDFVGGAESEIKITSARQDERKCGEATRSWGGGSRQGGMLQWRTRDTASEEDGWVFPRCEGEHHSTTCGHCVNGQPADGIGIVVLTPTPDDGRCGSRSGGAWGAEAGGDGRSAGGNFQNI
ncbi:hypothetical protein C8F04DRAFT_1193206 [Mycena alexandri]|uniref:Uncharacterized protein n=1 Tax=Mycena alexandri TaxID=1745969 RepID=A0AAD6SBM5_9AGAR|nr:hypothetical protein C8F04DRAFT_1193206 [Mycena alexandri]